MSRIIKSSAFFAVGVGLSVAASYWLKLRQQQAAFAKPSSQAAISEKQANEVVIGSRVRTAEPESKTELQTEKKNAMKPENPPETQTDAQPEPEPPTGNEATSQEDIPADTVAVKQAPLNDESENFLADDFTAIRGVGQKTAQTLIDNSITSYDDLAHAEPQDLFKLLEGKVRGFTEAKAADWIAQAKQLSS